MSHYRFVNWVGNLWGLVGFGCRDVDLQRGSVEEKERERDR